jgi:tripartite-type tricarboxylate transporter receptor subunit TctC
MELFSRQAGIRMLHVPYKGNAQSLADLLGGQVQVMFDQMSTSLAHVNAGKLRALGVTSRTRSPLLPELPTIDEQGMTGFEDVTWNALMAPAGTPRCPNCASAFSSARSSCRRARRSRKPPPS